MTLCRCVVMVLGFTVALSCGALDDAAQSDDSSEPPNCATVDQFGNGQTCSVKSPALDECGTAPERMCANGWLCFDAARFAYCSCLVDADCQGRADYINKARAVAKFAPLGAKCVAGRCTGAP